MTELLELLELKLLTEYKKCFLHFYPLSFNLTSYIQRSNFVINFFLPSSFLTLHYVVVYWSHFGREYGVFIFRMYLWIKVLIIIQFWLLIENKSWILSRVFKYFFLSYYLILQRNKAKYLKVYNPLPRDSDIYIDR